MPRHLPAKLTITVVWTAQLYFVLMAYGDPFKYFGYQPFGESSTWEATVVRVLPDGSRHDIRHGWEGYDWAAMVRGRGLDVPWHRHHAATGVDATLVRFQHALDWVALHTPRDTEALYLEAEVRYVRNRGEPQEVTLRSVERSAE
ncbi:MAG: hypothetical protein AAGE52_02575 [Myxococcota bacterium]